MPLADYEESLINSRAWSEPQHIEARLADITEHMETVIQKYLRTDYKTIHDYNMAAGEVAEPFHFVVVFDYPVNFSEASTRRLVSIARNGARCGVFVILVRDAAKPLPYGFTMDELYSTCNVVSPEAADGAQRPHLKWGHLRGWEVRMDPAASDSILSKIIKQVGAAAKGAMRVELPYEKLLQMASLERDVWWDPAHTTGDSIEVPLGQAGAKKAQYLMFGRGTTHHALIVGRTGSGKSTLMHVMILSMALKYSPKEVQLYLIDFKKGVEFNPYALARLPHALAIAVESEREFGLSVIERLTEEMKIRDPKFKAAGANDVSSFKKKHPDVEMPRIVLIIDEFQELFREEDGLSRKAAMLLSQIVLQGRSFGIHLVLGTQTLKRQMDLGSATFDQMAVRIALQCSDADSRLILADDNPEARLLSRPGEGIYNDAAGLFEGNHRFQVAAMTHNELNEHLASIRSFALSKGELREPIVFEGGKDADIHRCRPLCDLLEGNAWPVPAKGIDLYLGEPIAIRPPVAARLRRQSGSNLLLVTRNEAEGVGMLMAAAISMLLSLRPGSIRIGFINFASADDPAADYAPLLATLFPDRVSVCSKQSAVPAMLDHLGTLALGRSEGAPSQETYVLFLVGLHRIRRLREDAEDDNGPRAIESLRIILKEGPENGIHTIAWCDTWPNARNHLDDRLQNEFSLRVGGIMNGDDSRFMLDDDAAAKLDERRCLFYDEDRPGQLVKFRPYALPEPQWLHSAHQTLTKRQ
jgi:hypothetical protein